MDGDSGAVRLVEEVNIETDPATYSITITATNNPTTNPPATTDEVHAENTDYLTESSTDTPVFGNTHYRVGLP